MSNSAANGIDHDRGAVIRFHSSGMRVVMYSDTPGVYFDERGTLVNDKVAQGAGFNTAKLAKDRERQNQIANMRTKVEAEYQEFEDRMAAAASEGGGNFEVRHVGNNKYAVYDGDDRVTPFELSLSEAKAMIESLKPDEEPDDGHETEQPAATTGADAGSDEGAGERALGRGEAAETAAKATASNEAADTLLG